jgi:hypothetical protein
VEQLSLLERKGRDRCSDASFAVRSSGPPDNGSERYTNERILFTQPFTLGRSPEVYPAGMYQVETKKVAAEAGGHTAWIRSSTVLIVPTSTGSYCREVRGSELDESILRDTDHGLALEPSENPDRSEDGHVG